MILPVERKKRENLHVFGNHYKKEILTITLPSTRKIKIYGPNYQYGCNIAVTASYQTRESLTAQGAPEELIGEIGNKMLIGPPYTESMCIIRSYAIDMMRARYLKQNPNTREEGIKLEKNAKTVLESQSKFYNLDWESLKISP